MGNVCIMTYHSEIDCHLILLFPDCLFVIITSTLLCVLYLFHLACERYFL